MSVASRPMAPVRLWLFVGAVTVFTAAALPATRLAAGSIDGPAAGLAALILAAFIAVAVRHPVQIGPKRKVNVATPAQVAAVLLLPGPLAALTLLAGAIIGEAHWRAPLIQRLFNADVAVLTATAAALTRAALLHPGMTVITEPVSAIVAATVVHLTTNLLVAAVASVQLRENALRRTWASQQGTLQIESLFSLTGILAAEAAIRSPWALAIISAPALIAYRALRDSVALQAQTRLALEDLADVVDLRDHYTFEHSRRVAELARATARRLGLGADEVELITMAGRVHDVGKIGIKSSVLMKPGKLTDHEWHEMRSHPEVGARLIGNFPQFAHGRALVRHHHERYDGTGYPDGLAGEAIPYGARVLAVADAWDAMTSHRAYRRALDLDLVRAEMQRCSGTQFDPAVVVAFMAVLDERPDLAMPAEQVEQDVDEGLAPVPLMQPSQLAA